MQSSYYVQMEIEMKTLFKSESNLLKRNYWKLNNFKVFDGEIMSTIIQNISFPNKTCVGDVTDRGTKLQIGKTVQIEVGVVTFI